MSLRDSIIGISFVVEGCSRLHETVSYFQEDMELRAEAMPLPP